MATSQNQKEYLAKLLIIGEASVGKTSILQQYTEGIFQESTFPTLGIDYRIKRLKIENAQLKLQIWDTAGQERFRSITQNYYKGSMGIILTFSIENKDSFNSLASWLYRIREYSGENISIIILANKADLKPEVTDEQIIELENKQNVKCFKTSAKTNTGLQEAFEYISNQIYIKNFSTKNSESSENLNGKKKKLQQGGNSSISQKLQSKCSC